MTNNLAFPDQRIYAFSAATMSADMIAQHRSRDGLPLLNPGDILIYDFRESSSPFKDGEDTLSIAQWNIERGYKMPAILEALRNGPTPTDISGSDVLLLQELDISCERNGFSNNPLDLAIALKALVVYVVEFHELPEAVVPKRLVSACPPKGLKRTPAGDHVVMREDHSLVGCNYGFHGNAIVSRSLMLHSVRAFPHSAGIDWEGHHGYTRREPRRGRRAVLTASVDVTHRHPQRTLSPTGGPRDTTHLTRIALYSLHQEIFCGPMLRLRQLSDAMFDASSTRSRFLDDGTRQAPLSSNPSSDTTGTNAASAEGWDLVSPTVCVRDFNTVNEPSSPSESGCTMDDASAPLRTAPYTHTPNLRRAALPRQNRHFSVAIGGDLNTIQHGITRLSPTYSDFTRFLTVGETEAEWLQRRVFASKHLADRRRGGLLGVLLGLVDPTSAWRQSYRSFVSKWVYGLTDQDLFKMRNDELRLFDVFDKFADCTIDNPNYHGWVTGKLDWLLLSNLCVVQRSIGNHDYSLSDHKYLVNVVELPPFTADLVAGTDGGRKTHGRALRGSPADVASPTTTGSPGAAFPDEGDDDLSDMLLSHKVAYAIHADKRRKRTKAARLVLRGAVWAAVGYSLYAGVKKVASHLKGY